MIRTICTIEGNDVIENDNLSVTFSAGATIDGDGANGQFGGPPCYAPDSYNGQTLDYIRNAGHQGNWFGVVTDTGDAKGDPIVQDANDPCEGAYVSATSLELLDANGNRLPDSSPFKYVDSASVPYIVLPLKVIKGVDGIVLGCLCQVTNTATGQTVAGVVADVGPRTHLGEISVACAQAIGVPLGGGQYPANGGGADSPTIYYQVYPGTAAVIGGVTYPLQKS